MKRLITAVSLVALASFGAPANAKDDKKDADWKAESPVVVERAENGRATKVRVNGKVYEVCQRESQDNCIQPRAAGLNWGDRPLTYWPANRRGE